MKIKAFTSDQHYGHENIISFCKRPFASCRSMEETLIRNYNEIVKDGDVCIFVGDVFFCKDPDAKEIMQCLNGEKILIKGNHDKTNKKMLDIGFSAVYDRLQIEIDGTNITLCHYPPLMPSKGENTFDLRFKEKRPSSSVDNIIIHGHTHSSEKFNKDNFSIHVGVDAWNYSPATFEEVEQIVKIIKETI